LHPVNPRYTLRFRERPSAPGSVTSDNGGQAIVEFALVLPLLMLILLGFAEASIFSISVHSWQREADILADAASFDRLDQRVVADEDTLRGCGDLNPSLSYPDGSKQPGSRVRVTLRCRYRPALWNDFPGPEVTMTGEAVISSTGSSAPSGSRFPTGSPSRGELVANVYPSIPGLRMMRTRTRLTAPGFAWS